MSISPTQLAFDPGTWDTYTVPLEKPWQVLKVGFSGQGTLGSIVSKLVNPHWRHVLKAQPRATQASGLWEQHGGWRELGIQCPESR